MMLGRLKYKQLSH